LASVSRQFKSFVGGRFVGSNKTKADLESIEKKSIQVFADALFEEVVEVEVPECVKETPEDTGNLRDSIRAVGPFVNGKKISVKILAGDAATDDYALHVHEDLEAVHSVGGAKYIERPVKEAAPFMKDRVAKRIDLSKTKATK